MATSKTWTADDIELGKLTISRQLVPETSTNGIQFEQRYDFVDSLGDPVGIPGSRLVDIIAISSLPSNIASALATIEDWLYQKCLEQEGMQDA